MKKTLLSLAVILAVATAVVGGTYAVWSATTTIEGNTISTANVSLSQTGNIRKPITGYNMTPGDYTDTAKTGIFNQGSVPLKIYMETANLSDSSSGGICDHTLLSLYTGHANGEPTVDGDGRIIPTGEAERYIGTMSVLDWMTGMELTGYPPFTQLNDNTTQVIWQQAQLDPDAPQSIQNQTCSWDEVFIGETL